MTYCCNNIERASELIVRAARTINWSNDMNIGDGILGGLTLGIWSNVRASNNIDEAQSRMRRAYDNLRDAERAINSCNCGSDKNYWKDEESKERQKANGLVRDYNNLVEKINDVRENARERYNDLVGEWNELKGKYNNLIDKFNGNVADYNKLIGENKGLQERYGELNQRYNRINDDLEESREKIEQMRTRHEEETRRLNGDVLMLTRTEARLREEGVGLRRTVTERDQRLLEVGNEKNQLAITLRESNNQLAVIKEENSVRAIQLKNIQDKLTEVIEERDARITPLDLQELTQALFSKDERIEKLEKELNQSKEQSLEQKIRAEENRLEKMANRLKIDWEIVKILQDNYEELVRVRSNFDRNKIRVCQDAIEVIRQAMIGDNVEIDEVQDLAERCEKLAKLRVQVENHYQAQIEIN